MMGIAEIAGLIFSLVDTFGPRARKIWDDWHVDAGDSPTLEQWATLRGMIDQSTPESYEK